MDDPVASQALLSLVESEQVVRALHLLPEIISDKGLCRNRLLNYLSHESEYVVHLALAGLIKLGTNPQDSEVVTTALATYAGRVPCGISHIGVNDLIHWAPAVQSVRELAIHQIKNRGGAIATVARAYANDGELRKLILEQLNPLPSNLRLMLVNRLARLAPEDEYAHCLLRDFDEEVDSRVKLAAAVGYARSILQRGESPTLLVDQLGKTLHVTGPDHGERRQAAFAALLELDRMDIALAAAERDAPKKMRLGGVNPANLGMASHLVKHWDRVQIAFGGDFWEYIGYTSNEFFEELTSKTSDDDLIEALLAKVQKDKGQSMSLIELRIRSKQWRGTDRLRQTCLELVTKFGPSDWNHAAPGILAAEILGEQYAHDAEVYKQLIANRHESYNASALVVALCGAWLDSDALVRIRDNPKQRLMTPAQVHLFCRFSSQPEFVELLGSVLRKLTGEIWDFLPTCTRAIESRFKRDEKVRDAAFLRLEAGATPVEKCNLAQLLRRSDNRLDRLRTWARAELVRQHSGKQLPDSALDIYTGRIRPVAEVLMDLVLN